ncbi:Major facilitator superfamily [Macrophomina phaseolina MS6]|uniref:Major facilitator superfamily n=1 Tax=Macrophomina phaseolina (strain MS6) TaxID=1126212 RepID=K2SYE7_MACPH|nr:Major facilitator superfamily [Macrophomina phaseolina MS6]
MSTSDGDGDYESRGPIVLAVSIAMIVCSTVFLTARLASRIGIVKKIGWDDYFMTLAWVLAFGLSFAICYGVKYGLGEHEANIPDSQDPPLRKLEYVFTVLYNPCLMATKTSILVFYLTLSKSHRAFRWGVVATLLVVNLGGAALTVLNIVQCRPIGAAFVNPVPPGAHCTDIVTLYLSSAPLNIITDLATLFLPMPILTSMRLPKKQKTILVVTFGFGVFVAVVDVVRIAYLQSAATTRLRDIQHHIENNDSRNYEQSDFSWYASLSFLWSSIEVNVGICCGCVPALKPLVSRFLPRFIRDAGETVHSITHRRETFTDIDMINAQRIPSASDPSPTRPPPPASTNPDEPMGMIDFLTTPDMRELPECERTPTALTNTTRHTSPRSPTFFDFVHLKRKKSLVQLTNAESVFPVAMVTILFFLWGFAYGLLDVLNVQFQTIAGMSRGQTISIHSLYFAGYFVGPLTYGRLVLKKYGFKVCFMAGLCIYACGTLVFWPSAVLTSYPAFLISNFIVGLGLSTLEIAANPFTILCGPPRYAETRLNISQGVQAIGTIVSPLLAKKVLFRIDADSLIDVQWTYLGIALFTVLLAVAYYYVPIPEASDNELEDSAERVDDAHHARVFSIRIIWITLSIGALSQFFYVGFQESVSTGFNNYMEYVADYVDETNHLAYAHTAFAVSRFIAAFATVWAKPRYVLAFCYAGVLAFSGVCFRESGDTAAIGIVFTYFFEGPIFSLIFAQTLRGMGRHTKEASAIITASIIGGAIFPPINFAVGGGRNWQRTELATEYATISNAEIRDPEPQMGEQGHGASTEGCKEN